MQLTTASETFDVVCVAAQRFRNRVQEDRYGSSPPGQRKEPLAALHLHARKKGVWLDPRIGSAGDGHVSCKRCMLRAAAAVHHGVLLCLLLLVFGILAGRLSPFQKRQRRRAVEFRKVACILLALSSQQRFSLLCYSDG